jgi:DNA-binding transcriptional MerR regulator
MVFWITKAAKRAGVHANTLRELDKKGFLKIKRDHNGYRIFTGADIEEIKKLLYSEKGCQ